MLIQFRRVPLLLLALVCAPGGLVRADATTDGSAHPNGTIDAFVDADFEVPASLGSLRGRNLFHSFSQFGVAEDGSATFTGATGTIDHVIVRVTGGTGSSIDGRLVSTIGERSFVLVNPAGLTFGTNATLAVGGAFHASTANALRFDDGFELGTDATPLGAADGGGRASLLRFTSPSPAPITTRGSLRVAAGRDLSFVGGDLVFESAQVSSAGGRLALVSVGSPGAVAGVFDEGGALGLEGFTGRGRIRAENSLLSSTGVTGLESLFRHDLFGGELDGPLGSLYRVPVGQGPSDPSDVFLGFVDLSIGRRAYFFHVFARPEGSGDVWLRADSLTLRDAEITALNPGGLAGDIDVDLAGDLLLDSVSDDFDTGIFTGGIGFGGTLEVTSSSGSTVTLRVRSGLGGAGPAGAIDIAANDIDLRGGAAISSTSFSSGAGGEISIDASGEVAISGRSPAGTARGIFSSAQGTGDAGNITVEARSLRLDEGGAIIAQTTGNARAGDIAIDVETLQIRDGSQIDSSTSAQSLAADAPDPSTGDGGNVSVTATRSVSISGTGSDGGPSRLSTFSKERTIGRAGSISVVTPRLEVSDGGQISVRSSGAGLSGQIALDVETLALRDRAEISARADASGDAGEIVIRARDSVELDRAAITTAAPNANGGNVRIEARERVVLLRSEITASVGGGTGGNISIDPRFVVLNHSQIVAQAGEGTGGSIDITAEQFLRSVDSAVDASSRAGVERHGRDRRARRGHGQRPRGAARGLPRRLGPARGALRGAARREAGIVRRARPRRHARHTRASPSAALPHRLGRRRAGRAAARRSRGCDRALGRGARRLERCAAARVGVARARAALRGAGRPRRRVRVARPGGARGRGARGSGRARRDRGRAREAARASGRPRGCAARARGRAKYGDARDRGCAGARLREPARRGEPARRRARASSTRASSSPRAPAPISRARSRSPIARARRQKSSAPSPRSPSSPTRTRACSRSCTPREASLRASACARPSSTRRSPRAPRRSAIRWLRRGRGAGSARSTSARTGARRRSSSRAARSVQRSRPTRPSPSISGSGRSAG